MLLFGQLSVAACFVAALIARRRSRRPVAIALMVATLIVLGLP